MRLFSVSTILEKATESFRRFPLPLLFSFGAVVIMICLNHLEYAARSGHIYERLAMTAYLGMLLTISVTLFAERFVMKFSHRTVLAFIAVGLAALYFYSLPESMNTASGIRFAVLAISLHLLVAFAPFILADEMNGLWQFNKSLFIRILTSGVYSAVLFGGLALALLAIDNLFEVQIDDEYYFDLWLIIAGVFNTWFFLSGVPENTSALERATDYPKGLKLFTLYVLLPLITVYLVILYAYAAKILLTSHWPVGWVANLVLAFSIFGILSFLLIYPLRDDEANPWVKFYSRLFNFLLVPLIVLLYISIFKRIEEYGITVARYYVLLLALWLTFIAAYNILTGGKRIRVIPLSLCIIGLLSTFGSWGAFAVSHRSQIGELSALFESNSILVNGKVDTTTTHDVQAADYDRIQSIVNYIEEFHGHQELQQYFDQNIDTLHAADSPEGGFGNHAGNTIVDMLHIQRVESDSGLSFLHFSVGEKAMFNTEGFDFAGMFTRANYGRAGDTTATYVVSGDTVNLIYSDTLKSFTLTSGDLHPLVIELDDMIASLPKDRNNEVSPEIMTVVAENPFWKARIVFRSLEIQRDNGALKIDVAEGLLMLTFAERGTR